MTGCRVFVNVPHRHQRGGRSFHILVDISVPGGGPIVISHRPGPEDAAEDVDTAIHQAFDAARRDIQDFVREQRV